MKRILTHLVVGFGLLGMAAGAVHAGTLDDVRKKGYVQVGVSTGLLGFSAKDANGDWSGIDTDYGRAIAVAVFNDPTKVKFVALNAKERFTALQTGEIDVLVRNSTWNLTRDTSLGLSFAGVNFYDGQGFMVKKALGVKSAKELNGASVCVQTGTTTELNLADWFKANGLTYKPVVFEKLEDLDAAFQAGRCDVDTTDQSGLYASRLVYANPDDYLVLPEIISKEPLGPVVKAGDTQWFNIVKWVHYGLVSAEELGVTKANVEQMKKSDNPAVKRLLGVDSTPGKGLGLSDDFVANIVAKLGNYGEIFEADVGKGSKLKIARGLNALWSKGGLQYSPPFD